MLHQSKLKQTEKEKKRKQNGAMISGLFPNRSIHAERSRKCNDYDKFFEIILFIVFIQFPTKEMSDLLVALNFSLKCL